MRRAPIQSVEQEWPTLRWLYVIAIVAGVGFSALASRGCSLLT